MREYLAIKLECLKMAMNYYVDLERDKPTPDQLIEAAKKMASFVVEWPEEGANNTSPTIETSNQ